MRMVVYAYTLFVSGRICRTERCRAAVFTNDEDRRMDKNEIGGNWHIFKGKIKEEWGRLTDDDLFIIEGKREQLIGKLQERYGYEKSRAEEEVSEWEKRDDYRW